MCSTCPRCLCPQRAPRIPNTDKALNLNDRGEPWPCPWPPTRRGAGGTLPCEVATVTFWPSGTSTETDRASSTSPRAQQGGSIHCGVCSGRVRPGPAPLRYRRGEPVDMLRWSAKDITRKSQKAFVGFRFSIQNDHVIPCYHTCVKTRPHWRPGHNRETAS